MTLVKPWWCCRWSGYEWPSSNNIKIRKWSMACVFFGWFLIWKTHIDRCASCSPTVCPTNWSSLVVLLRNTVVTPVTWTLWLTSTFWQGGVYLLWTLSEMTYSTVWYCLLLGFSNEVCVLPLNILTTEQTNLKGTTVVTLSSFLFLHSYLWWR